MCLCDTVLYCCESLLSCSILVSSILKNTRSLLSCLLSDLKKDSGQTSGWIEKCNEMLSKTTAVKNS